MKKGTIVGLVVGVVLVILVLTGIGSYNKMTTSRENVDTKLSDVDVYLQRRADLRVRIRRKQRRLRTPVCIIRLIVRESLNQHISSRIMTVFVQCAGIASQHLSSAMMK